MIQSLQPQLRSNEESMLALSPSQHGLRSERGGIRWMVGTGGTRFCLSLPKITAKVCAYRLTEETPSPVWRTATDVNSRGLRLLSNTSNHRGPGSERRTEKPGDWCSLPLPWTVAQDNPCARVSLCRGRALAFRHPPAPLYLAWAHMHTTLALVTSVFN